MSTVYSTYDPNVNGNLFCVPTIEELRAADTKGHDMALRLSGIDFEPYRELVEAAVRRHREKSRVLRMQNRLLAVKRESLPLQFQDAESSNARPDVLERSDARGAPSMDALMMLKLLILQRAKCLSDAAMAFEVSDRASVQRFLSLPPGAGISRQTIWNYRQIFAQSEVMELIALHHVEHLQTIGLISTDQSNPLILDSSFVEAPKQRNTHEENARIKAGASAEELWPGEENKHKRRHKDVDASWTKKGDKTYFGYKLHALVEGMGKFMIYMKMTTAKVHDSQVIPHVLSDEDAGRDFHADSAYSGTKQNEQICSFGLWPRVCEKGFRDRPLTPRQKKENRKKSRIRSRIEHVFGFIEGTMRGSIVRTVGLDRATFNGWLTMFCCNIARQETLMRCRKLE